MVAISTQLHQISGIGVACNRILNGRHARIPQDAQVVACDNHWTISEDIFFREAPAQLRDEMPRIWWDDDAQIFNIGPKFNGLYGGELAPLIKSIEDRSGSRCLRDRLVDLDDEGVSMEIVFPQSLQFYFNYPNFEAREWVFRVYNEYIANISNQSGGRFFGVGIPNYWDQTKTRSSLRQIVDLGLKTYQIPINPGIGSDGVKIDYAGENMDLFWDAVAEVGLPVCFHIGEAQGYGGRGGTAITAFQNFGPFRKTMGELIFGGILDRHPSLQINFVEANVAWVPAALQDAELIIDTFDTLLKPRPEQRPTDYWRRNLHATFQYDKVGMRLIDMIGPDRIMWGHDYPHNEGTLGFTADALNLVRDSVPDADARKMLGENAISLFDLPRCRQE